MFLAVTYVGGGPPLQPVDIRQWTTAQENRTIHRLQCDRYFKLCTYWVL